jgi:hypothetical protein
MRDTTKVSTLKNTLKEIILNSIEPEDCDSHTYLNNPDAEEKVDFFFDCFKHEYLHAHNIRRFKGSVPGIMKEYLMGLPSTVKFPFSNYEILKLGKLCGFEFGTEEAEDVFIARYWNLLAQSVMELGEEYGIRYTHTGKPKPRR